MSTQISDIKTSCLEKWRNGEPTLDERLQFFDEKFESWLQQIPEANQATVITLIKHLEYYSHQATNTWLKTLHGKLIESSTITDDNTIYAFIKSKDGITNSSNDYWTEYKFINNLNKNICIENMDSHSPEVWPYIQNIVFIDDFSGSGQSFIDELKKNPDRYRDKNVFFITINAMIQAIDAINAYCAEAKINIVLLSAFTQNKAFEQNFFEDNTTAMHEIADMSKDFKIPECARMGYKDSQSLVAFYNNTPNNTLGFIRYDTKKYQSIFPRKDNPIPSWQKMSKELHRRNRANYKNKVEGTKDE